MHRLFKAVFALLCLISIGQAAEPADWIIRAKYVITMNPQRHVITNGAVALRGEKIVGVGTQAEIEREFKAKNTLDRKEDALTPGLIDTHTHAGMSLFRAIADDMRLQDWLSKFIFPAESKNVNAEFVKWATRLACLEMVLSGTTTYTDMYYFEETVAETTKEAGLRGVLGQTVIGFPAPDYKTPQEALAATERYIRRFKNDPLIVPAVAPHAIYTTPNEALVASHRLATKYSVPLLIHLAETKAERDEALAKRNMTPAQVLDKLGILNGRVVAAHGVWNNDEDLALLKRHGTGVAHCPSSNTKLASGIAPVVKMLKMGIPVGLGTDGFAGSNDTADLIQEMNLAAKLQKVTQMDPTVLSAKEVLSMATIGGARVLGLEKEIGSLEVGKRADLITISLRHPNAVPLYNVYSQIAYAAKATDVEDVFINGKPIVRNRRALTLNQEQILTKAREYQIRIAQSVKH